jgi:D-alanine-D-alanine ligase
LKIGLTFILKEENIGKTQYLSEFDSIEVIQRLEKAIQANGHEVINLGFGEKFIENLIEYKPDIVFNYAEGIYGSSREAQIPSIVEMLQIPMIGSNAFCMTLTQNKHVCNLYCREKGIPTPRGIWIDTPNIDRKMFHHLKYPLIVKPCREGSSYGIDYDSIVKDFGGLQNQIEIILEEFQQPVLVEEYIQGREICVGIIGNNPPQVLPLLEIVFESNETHKDILTYKMKVDDKGFTEGKADIDKKTEEKIKKIALTAYTLLHCTEYTRIDFRISQDLKPYIIDVNPTPSLKDNSFFASCAYLANYTYDDLIKEIIDAGFTRNSLV